MTYCPHHKVNKYASHAMLWTRRLDALGRLRAVIHQAICSNIDAPINKQ